MRCTVAPVKKGALAVAVIAVLAVGAVVVSSSAGAGGGKGPYRFYSGVYVRDQGSFGRIYVENLTNKEITVKVKFSDESEADKLDVPAGGVADVTNSICSPSACEERVVIQSKTAMIVPTLRWGDTQGGIQERSGGDFVVTRDGKRVW